MAIRPSAAGTNLALELDGEAAGALRSALPAGYRIARIARTGASAAGTRPLRDEAIVSLAAMAAEADLPDKGPLLDWLQALLSGQQAPRNGAVQVADHHFAERRRLEFRDAQLTEVSWQGLSAAEGKRPFFIGLAWQPGAVDDRAGSGQRLQPAVSRRKPPMCSNFRVSGLPFDGQFTTEVDLPSVALEYSAADPRRPDRAVARLRLGELRLQIAARSTGAVTDWVRKLVGDGRVDPAETLSLTVELLDTSLKKVLASFQMTGCELQACDEARLGGGAERSEGVTLRFAVQQLGLETGG